MILHHLNNPFDNERISEDDFNKIGLTHLERLDANNQNGDYTSMISSTKPLYETYKQSASAEAFEKALREGKTISVDQAITGMKHFVSRKEGVIKDKFFDKPEKYEIFFPQGLTEYSQATKGNIDMLFKRFVDAIDAHTQELGQPLKQEAETLYNNYVTLREAQLESIGEVKELDSEADAARFALAIQLFKNLLGLIGTFAEDTERVKDFFDLSITASGGGGGTDEGGEEQPEPGV